MPIRDACGLQMGPSTKLEAQDRQGGLPLGCHWAAMPPPTGAPTQHPRAGQGGQGGRGRRGQIQIAIARRPDGGVLSVQALNRRHEGPRAQGEWSLLVHRTASTWGLVSSQGTRRGVLRAV